MIDKAPIFAARLVPYRSLGNTGFWLLMAFVCLTCFLSGILFLAIGAWPVFLFFGLDLLLIWGAFKLSYRSGKAYEEIAVWKHELEFRQIAPSGKVKVHLLNPFWTKFHVDRHDEIGITKMVLVEKGNFLNIGSFLNPQDRESFANALGLALAKAKSG
ncbi:MAG: DUF2244 domain-containing protein [Salaquimonas sp.]